MKDEKSWFPLLPGGDPGKKLVKAADLVEECIKEVAQDMKQEGWHGPYDKVELELLGRARQLLLDAVKKENKGEA